MKHHYLLDNFLTEKGEAGRTYDLLIEAYAGHFFPESELGGCATGPVLPGTYTDPKEGKLRTALGDMTYGIWNEDAYQLYLDLMTLYLLGEEQDPESLRADRIADALQKATLTADFEQPRAERIESYRAAREVLRPALEAVNGSTMPDFYAIGNAHLDLAWLWPMAETRRKTSRTFAQQLRLIDAYPEYKYLQSQPAAYEMCRECYPELFERIQAAAKKGQWIPEGAMWVEPDTNMTSGESLVRQVIHGKRYFKEYFDVDSVVLWLPDTFGYSAALPQILKSTGVKYLVTQKIFWSYNEGDQFTTSPGRARTDRRSTPSCPPATPTRRIRRRSAAPGESGCRSAVWTPSWCPSDTATAAAAPPGTTSSTPCVSRISRACRT